MKRFSTSCLSKKGKMLIFIIRWGTFYSELFPGADDNTPYTLQSAMEIGQMSWSSLEHELDMKKHYSPVSLSPH